MIAVENNDQEEEIASLVKVKDFEDYVRQAIVSGLLDKQYEVSAQLCLKFYQNRQSCYSPSPKKKRTFVDFGYVYNLHVCAKQKKRFDRVTFCM